MSKACKHPYKDESRWFCLCHEKMGNDYYFLPTGRCLYEDDKSVTEERPNANS